MMELKTENGKWTVLAYVHKSGRLYGRLFTDKQSFVWTEVEGRIHYMREYKEPKIPKYVDEMLKRVCKDV